MTKCGECGSAEFLRECKWGFGRKRYWRCDMCFKRVDPVTDLEDHPDLAELGLAIQGFYGDPWAATKVT